MSYSTGVLIGTEEDFDGDDAVTVEVDYDGFDLTDAYADERSDGDGRLDEALYVEFLDLGALDGSQYSINEAENILAALFGFAENGIDPEGALNAYVEAHGEYYAHNLEADPSVVDMYAGDPGDWAQEQVESRGIELPDAVRAHVDWDAVARDLAGEDGVTLVDGYGVTYIIG